jgi:putative oxidoreductase
MNTALWDSWAPLAARILLAIQFGVAAWFKISAFSMEASMTAAAGVPFATVAVAAALVLEVAGVISLLTGYYIRVMSFLLAGFVMLLSVIFYHNWSDQMQFGMFVSHLGLTAALLLLSVRGKGFTKSSAPAA